MATDKVKVGMDKELLVFGYSCKIFNDNEKALYIDQGKHLIPWMGNDDLKIDRYDVRGTVSELFLLEGQTGGYDQFLGLTETERKIEAMCDEERYRALHTNEEEERLYQEEELKRLEATLWEERGPYSEVSYTYENKDPDPSKEGVISSAESDVPFVPSPLLDIPVQMTLPETVKQNAVIEKTAMFIGSQGPQMEILLKIKQAKNPLFNFLSFDNSLHGYYRLVLNAVKSGRYKPTFEEEVVDDGEDSGNSEGDDGYYLHPSLALTVPKNEETQKIPNIAYKPSADCAYTMLISKLKNKTASSETGHDGVHQSTEIQNEENESQSMTVVQGAEPIKSRRKRPPCVVTPPDDLQAVIDKMASYVAKNGADFENVVRGKKDPRFDFLDSEHKYRGYYEAKLGQFLYKKNKELQKALKVPEEDVQTELDEDSKGKKVTPISFSIKAKDSGSVIEKSDFPVEESSEEETENNATQTTEVKSSSRRSETEKADGSSKSKRRKKDTSSRRSETGKTEESSKSKRHKKDTAHKSAKKKEVQLERKRKVAEFLRSLSGTK